MQINPFSAMNKEECPGRLLNWCQEQGEWKARAEVAEEELEFALRLDRSVPPRMVVEVTERKGEDWIVLQHVFKVPRASLAPPDPESEPTETNACDQLIESIVSARAGLFQGGGDFSGKSYVVDFGCRIYLDGLSKHALFGALDELRKARKMFDAIISQMDHQRTDIARIRKRLAEATQEPERVLDERKSLLDVPVPRTPPSIPPPAARSCAKCGHIILPGKKFCTACGSVAT